MDPSMRDPTLASGTGSGAPGRHRDWMRRSLRDVLLLRSIAWVVLLAALLLLYRVVGDETLPWPVWGVAAGIFLFTGASAWRLRRGAAVSERTFLQQLLVDLLGLALMLAWTGGSANPLASLLLLPVVVSAATLGLAGRWLTLGVAVGAYTALLFLHRPLPSSGDAAWDFQIHIWGMWLGFVVAAGLVASFVARIAWALREKDRALAALRESALRSDRLGALGALAAGTAHELATPLGTMAVTVGELQHDSGASESVRAGLALLRGQIARCKETLARMADDAGQVQAGSGRRVRLDAFLEDLVQRWAALRPDVPLRSRIDGARPAPLLVLDRSLDQALLTVFDNAADADPHGGVDFEGEWDRCALRLCVRDRGQGLAASVRPHLGRVVRSTKRGGLGLGLVLAEANLARLGGEIRLRDRPGGGVRAEITLPLAPFEMR